MRELEWIEAHQKNDWVVKLWNDGTQEVSNARGFFSCLYWWEEASALGVPKYVVRMIVEQRIDFKGEINL
jgi:hypothetical protein